MAEASVEEGNANLAQCLKSSTLGRKGIQSAQSKIDMGVKRKQELTHEIEILVKKRKKIGSAK